MGEENLFEEGGVSESWSGGVSVSVSGNWSSSSVGGISWGSVVSDGWSSSGVLDGLDSWGRVGDGNWSGNVLDNWSVGSIGMGFSNGVGEVSSKSVALDDSGIESWGSGDDSWSVGNWGNKSGRSHGGEGKNSDDGLQIEKTQG